MRLGSNAGTADKPKQMVKLHVPVHVQLALGEPRFSEGLSPLKCLAGLRPGKHLHQHRAVSCMQLNRIRLSQDKPACRKLAPKPGLNKHRKDTGLTPMKAATRGLSSGATLQLPLDDLKS